MISFEEIWNKTSKIYGAFEQVEAEVLYNLAVAQGEGANFVEIGSYCGKSSSVLGQIAKVNNCDLVCIDCFVDLAPGCKSRKDIIKRFKKNMWITRSKYELWEMESKKAAKKYNKEIDVLFIDANHHEWGVREDCEFWLPKLKVGGCVLFHDYISEGWLGVKKAADKFINNYKLAGSAHSLIAKKKVEA